MDGYSSGLRGLFAKQLEHEHVAQVRILYHPPYAIVVQLVVCLTSNQKKRVRIPSIAPNKCMIKAVYG